MPATDGALIQRSLVNTRSLHLHSIRQGSITAQWGNDDRTESIWVGVSLWGQLCACYQCPQVIDWSPVSRVCHRFYARSKWKRLAQQGLLSYPFVQACALISRTCVTQTHCILLPCECMIHGEKINSVLDHNMTEIKSWTEKLIWFFTCRYLGNQTPWQVWSDSFSGVEQVRGTGTKFCGDTVKESQYGCVRSLQGSLSGLHQVAVPLNFGPLDAIGQTNPPCNCIFSCKD